MKKYTIQDLKDGKVAVKNDGTIEELREVIKKAFPKTYLLAGSYLYYFRYSPDEWDCYDTTTLPTQSVKDFLSEYPKEMWVWDDDKLDKSKELVVGELLGGYMVKDKNKVDTYYYYKNAEDIKDEKIEVSLKEIAEKFGVDVECLQIVEK